MFDHILVPVDGSNDGWVALGQAIEIAREEESTIHAIFVADSRIIEAPYWTAAPPDEPLPGADPEQTDVALAIGQMISDFGNKVLTETEQRCQDAEVACETEYRVGAVVNEILDASEFADLVVIGRYGQGAAWAGPNFGSVFEAVVRHAKAPVLAAQAEVRPILKILVAYDGSARAMEALRIGANCAKSQDRELVVLVVNDGHPEMQGVFDDLKDWLVKHDVAAKTLFVEGSPAETILRVEREEDCSLIIMGAYGHSRFLQIFFGSTVDEVVHQAITPVLVCH
jgi:nucleotide-binding universal stress UspA family protein